jgi:hypothetical protein
MGSVAWGLNGGAIEDVELKRRLLGIADAKAYRAWKQKLSEDADLIDFASLDVAELADAWIEINRWPPVRRERDRNAANLFDYQCGLPGVPERALELIAQIARKTDDARLIGLVGAGMLEDLLPRDEGPLLDAIERAAAANPVFRSALCGAYLSGVSPAVAARINLMCERAPAAGT